MMVRNWMFLKIYLGEGALMMNGHDPNQGNKPLDVRKILNELGIREDRWTHSGIALLIQGSSPYPAPKQMYFMK
jgi:hypothetical protein